MSKNRKIQVKETDITKIIRNNIDFISLTDMTISFNEGSGLIGKWITNKNTFEYIGTWEKINNPNFNYPEFRVIENDAGVNRFIMYKENLIPKELTKSQIQFIYADEADMLP